MEEENLEIVMTGAELAMLAMSLTSYLDLADVVRLMTSGLERDDSTPVGIRRKF